MLKTNLNRFLTNQPTSLGKYQKTTEQQGPLSRGNPNQYGKTGELTYLYGTGEDRGRQGKIYKGRQGKIYKGRQGKIYKGRQGKIYKGRQGKTAEDSGRQGNTGEERARHQQGANY